MKKRRVVITGLGVVAPNGIGKNEFWQACIQGKSGIDYITHFDTSKLDAKICGRVNNFDPLDFMSARVARSTDRFVHLGLAASRMAIDDANLNLEKENRKKIGVSLGSGLGGLPFHEEQMIIAYKKGFDKINPLSIPKISPNAVSSYIAMEFNLNGPNIVISTACASSNYAIIEACNQIQNGEAEISITGGVEAPITEFMFAAYGALKVLSLENNFPKKASRPFDKNRDGFVLSEGAGILVLEELSHALDRNAYIYAEIIGYASNSGAYHIVIPEPNGHDTAEVMHKALKNSNIDLKEIDYINAHGTSTKANDLTETKAIKKVFGKHAYNIPISSTKSMIGHTIGAAGGIEAVVCALAIDTNIIPPTINYQFPDPECDLDYVPKTRKGRIDTAMSNSFGFGNCNGCVIFKRY